MAQNSTSLCTFSTLEDAYKAIQSTATSVEDLVNQCPNVCTLAYGNGNPDLSGLGMMSCHMLDVAFSLLCGPIYMLASRYYRWKTNETPKIEPQKLFFEAQGLFTVPLLIAAVVRIEGAPPLFEIAFLQNLNTTLASSFFVSFWSLYDSLRRWPMVFYTCCVAVLQIIAIARSESQKAISMNGRQMIDHCSKHSATAPQYVGQDWRLQIAVSCVVVGIAVTIPAIAYLISVSLFSRSVFTWKLVFQIYSVCCAGLALYGATQLFATREAMKNATGSGFGDDKWGFGQVAAIFMWIPWVIQSAEHIYNAWHPNPKQDPPPSRDSSSVGQMSEC
ncbi:MAG: hypothetical protein M1813_007359 [Trichoglossum hirsutum]|nr:MAG: hypothetical protein M1813_007359 [Trichoglossum hirsutum]